MKLFRQFLSMPGVVGVVLSSLSIPMVLVGYWFSEFEFLVDWSAWVLIVGIVVGCAAVLKSQW